MQATNPSQTATPRVIPRKTYTEMEKEALYEAKLASEEVGYNIMKLVWALIMGCCKWIYAVFFALAITIMQLLIIGTIWMIVAYGIVGATEILGDIVQIFITILNDLASAINTVEGGLSSGMSDVSSAFGGGSSCSIPPFSIPDVAGALGGFYTTLLAIDSTCNAMDTWLLVLSAFAKTICSKITCPFLRYVSVVPVVSTGFEGIIGWTSFPWLPIDGENCATPEGETLCMWINMWRVILDLCIPLVIIKCFVEAFWKPIMIILTWIWEFITFIARIVSGRQKSGLPKSEDVDLKIKTT